MVEKLLPVVIPLLSFSVLFLLAAWAVTARKLSATSRQLQLLSEQHRVAITAHDLEARDLRTKLLRVDSRVGRLGKDLQTFGVTVETWDEALSNRMTEVCDPPEFSS